MELDIEKINCMIDIKYNTLLQLSDVSYSVTKNDGGRKTILDKLNLSLHSGEIVAILGKSGSGKSTLLRIIAGLIKPTKGKIKFYGKKSKAENVPHDIEIGMIFQNFALFPWLNVLENVELGLESIGIAKKERQAKALRAIDLIGLDGFESAFPRELSGGMKQRVSFARSLVLEPQILLMDEPFSALDILTANNLKNDLLDLWHSKKTNLQSIILVTHSIEEAVMLADRVLIFASDPGYIGEDIEISLKYPRNNEALEFRELVNKIYNKMFANIKKYSADIRLKQVISKKLDISQKLHFISSNQLAGMAEGIINYGHNGSASLSDLVNKLHLHISDILPVAETLNILKLANIVSGNIKLNKAGKLFASGDSEQKKIIFSQHLLKYIPLASYILQVLEERPKRQAHKLRFKTELEDYLSPEEANTTLKTIIAWGRYGEIFEYNDNKQLLYLT